MPEEKKIKNPKKKAFPIERVLETLDNTYDEHPMAIITHENAYKVLIACLLSLRTKDETMIPAATRLFAVADTPEKLVKLTAEEIQKLVFPVGFYRNKSQTLLEVSHRILEDFEGNVPKTMDELLSLKGVGRKTANLVLGLGHGIPAICVDVHVHRISNRLGYIKTKDPEETEMKLRKILPVPYWHIINKVMVLHGQQTCKPVGARCDICPVELDCQKIEVKSRKVPV